MWGNYMKMTNKINVFLFNGEKRTKPNLTLTLSNNHFNKCVLRICEV